jgi:hypothetical protein
MTTAIPSRVCAYVRRSSRFMYQTARSAAEGVTGV